MTRLITGRKIAVQDKSGGGRRGGGGRRSRGNSPSKSRSNSPSKPTNISPRKRLSDLDGGQLGEGGNNQYYGGGEEDETSGVSPGKLAGALAGAIIGGSGEGSNDPNNPNSNGTNPKSSSESDKTKLQQYQLPPISKLNRSFSLLSARDCDGFTPFILCAQYNLVETMEWLYLHGACVEEQDNWGRTALQWACYKHCGKAITYLLSRGAAVAHLDHDGMTALHWAATKDHCQQQGFCSDAVQRLIFVGAHALIDTKDSTGATPMSIAWRRRNYVLVLYFWKVKILQKLFGRSYFLQQSLALGVCMSFWANLVLFLLVLIPNLVVVDMPSFWSSSRNYWKSLGPGGGDSHAPYYNFGANNAESDEDSDSAAYLSSFIHSTFDTASSSSSSSKSHNSDTASNFITENVIAMCFIYIFLWAASYFSWVKCARSDPGCLGPNTVLTQKDRIGDHRNFFDPRHVVATQMLHVKFWRQRKRRRIRRGGMFCALGNGGNSGNANMRGPRGGGGRWMSRSGSQFGAGACGTDCGPEEGPSGLGGIMEEVPNLSAGGAGGFGDYSSSSGYGGFSSSAGGSSAGGYGGYGGSSYSSGGYGSYGNNTGNNADDIQTGGCMSTFDNYDVYNGGAGFESVTANSDNYGGYGTAGGFAGGNAFGDVSNSAFNNAFNLGGSSGYGSSSSSSGLYGDSGYGGGTYGNLSGGTLGSASSSSSGSGAGGAGGGGANQSKNSNFDAELGLDVFGEDDDMYSGKYIGIHPAAYEEHFIGPDSFEEEAGGLGGIDESDDLSGSTSRNALLDPLNNTMRDEGINASAGVAGGINTMNSNPPSNTNSATDLNDPSLRAILDEKSLKDPGAVFPAGSPEDNGNTTAAAGAGEGGVPGEGVNEDSISKEKASKQTLESPGSAKNASNSVTPRDASVKSLPGTGQNSPAAGEKNASPGGKLNAISPDSASATINATSTTSMLKRSNKPNVKPQKHHHLSQRDRKALENYVYSTYATVSSNILDDDDIRKSALVDFALACDDQDLISTREGSEGLSSGKEDDPTSSLGSKESKGESGGENFSKSVMGEGVTNDNDAMNNSFPGKGRTLSGNSGNTNTITNFEASTSVTNSKAVPLIEQKHDQELQERISGLEISGDEHGLDGGDPSGRDSKKVHFGGETRRLEEQYYTPLDVDDDHVEQKPPISFVRTIFVGIIFDILSKTRIYGLACLLVYYCVISWEGTNRSETCTARATEPGEQAGEERTYSWVGDRSFDLYLGIRCIEARIGESAGKPGRAAGPIASSPITSLARGAPQAVAASAKTFLGQFGVSFYLFLCIFCQSPSPVSPPPRAD